MSLKYKIISLITLFSALSSLLVLIIAINAFKSDKTAFIFETSLNTSRFLSEQLKSEIENKSAVAKAHLKVFFSNKENQTLDDTESLSGIKVSIVQNQESLDLKTVFAALKKADQGASDILKLKPIEDQIQKSFLDWKSFDTKEGLFIQDQNIYIYEFIKKNGIDYHIIYYFKSSVLEKIFNSNNYFKSILIDSSGNIIGQNFAAENKKFKDEFTDFDRDTDLKQSDTFQKILNTSVFMMNSKSSKSWMFSSSAVGYFKIFFVTTVSEESVFGFLNKLYLNSIYIFCILISCVILTGIIVIHFIVRRLHQLTKAAMNVSNGNFDIQVDTYGKDEVGVLSNAFSEMIQKIQVLIQEVAGKTRMESELKTAQIVQSTLFPQNEANLLGVNVKGFFKSASECGGDWWHYHESADSVWFWIADATGHGVSAALVTSACKSAVHLIQKMNCEPEVAVRFLNSSIHAVSGGQMMMTCFCAKLIKKTKVLKFVNASHEIPIFFENKNNLDKEDLKFLFDEDAKNKRLGQQADSVFLSKSIQLKEKDRIFFYTDGFFELKTKNNSEFKERDLIKKIVNANNQTVGFSDFAEVFKKDILDNILNQQLADDLTYFFIEVL